MNIDTPIHIFDMAFRACGGEAHWDDRLFTLIVKVAIFDTAQRCFAGQPPPPELSTVRRRICVTYQCGNTRAAMKRGGGPPF